MAAFPPKVPLTALGILPGPSSAASTLLGAGLPRTAIPTRPPTLGYSSLADLACVTRASAAATILGGGVGQPAPGHSALASLFVTPPSAAHSLLSGASTGPAQWIYVRRRFSQFLSNLEITPTQRRDGDTKHGGVRDCLNRHYWGTSSGTANSFLIGSWGKGTQVRPPRDVDVLFLLPAAVYHRFQQRGGNRQSDLLQEVKGVIASTYSQTTMRGDGQVIVINFGTTKVELSPGFRCTDGSIIICDTNTGGSYKTSTAEAELHELSASDTRWNGNTRALIRMLKQWQREHNVPLKSFQIERLAIQFLATWPNSQYDVFWYDWMVRDFFSYLMMQANTHLVMPGTGELIWLGSDWLVRAERAYKHAVSACENESGNYEALAGGDWQKIFGIEVPVIVS